MIEEAELTEQEIKQLAIDQQQEKKTDILKVENKVDEKKNKNFKKMKEMPIIKGGLIFKKLQYGKKLKWQDELEKEMKEEKPNLERIKLLSKKIKEKGEVEEAPVKSPVIEMIRADNSVEWFEGAKAGTLEITRSDEKIAYINLEKGKLLTDNTRNTDGSIVHKWIVYENDHSPLPTNVFMDSHAIFSNYEEVLSNKKDVQTERINAKGDLIWKIMIPIVAVALILFIGMPLLTGQNLSDFLPSAEEQANATCGAYTMNLGQLTIEEAQIIKQYRTEIGTSEPNES